MVEVDYIKQVIQLAKQEGLTYLRAGELEFRLESSKQEEVSEQTKPSSEPKSESDNKGKNRKFPELTPAQKDEIRMFGTPEEQARYGVYK